MYKLIAISAAVLSASFSLRAQTIKGKVTDSSGEPIEFATAAVISLPDSTIHSGAMTAEDGTFEMEIPSQQAVVRVFMIGYQTVTISADMFRAGTQTITLADDSVILDGAVVKAELPSVELRGNALVTNVAGSVLEHQGNAEDVLEQIPGIIRTNEGFEVIGRGAPQFYINGRKVNNNDELRNLTSEEIRGVELISNPGAAYGGETRAAVRILTVRRQGEGLSFALTNQTNYWIVPRTLTPSWTVLDLKWRKKAVDVFAKINYYRSRDEHEMYVSGGTYLPDYINEQSGIRYTDRTDSGIDLTVGVNWQISGNHTVGIQIEPARTLFNRAVITNDEDIFSNGDIIDHLHSVSDSKSGDNNLRTNANLYYSGKVGKVGIDWNTDFIKDHNDESTDIHEESIGPVQDYTSFLEASTDLIASKLVFTIPVGKGQIAAGTEATTVATGEKYEFSDSIIGGSDYISRESNIAGFAEYGVMLPVGRLSLGLRYEHVGFSHENIFKPDGNIGREQDNWFPSVSFATKIGPVGLQLSCTNKTERPSFNMMSSEVSYQNRFIYTTGNPLLENRHLNITNLSARWKWIAFSTVYEHCDNSFVQWYSPYNDEGAVILDYRNIDVPKKKITTYFVFTPKAGAWNLSYTLAVDKPFLTLDLEDPTAPGGMRTNSLNKPVFVARLNNAFRFRKDWQASMDYRFTSRGNQDNYELTRCFQRLDIGIQKSLLKDKSLTIRLRWQDVLHTEKNYVGMDFGMVRTQADTDKYSSSIVFGISYSINSTSSKYKGTGAGASVKERL